MRIVRRGGRESGWEWLQAAPDPRLAGCVRGPYTGWVEGNGPTAVRREPAKPVVPLIVSFGAPFRVGRAGDVSGVLEIHDSFLAGPHDAFVDTESPSGAACLQVDLTPEGAFRLLRQPMHALANRVVGLDALLGQAGVALAAHVGDVQEWDERFAVLEAFLVARLTDSGPLTPEVAWALGRLEDTAGGCTVAALAEEIGWSHKRLIARFRAEIGLAPKAMARIYRFDRARARLGAEGAAAVALDCGYYDQAHMNREYRALAGLTPRESLAATLSAPATAD